MISDPGRAAPQGVMEFDPYSEAFFEDPWEIYRWLRDEQPVYHHEGLGFWAVSRYDDCVEVHRDTATFTTPHSYAEGFSHVIVNGQVVFENGEMTAARPVGTRGSGHSMPGGGGCGGVMLSASSDATG